MKTSLPVLAAAAAALAAPVWGQGALDFRQARAAGIIGERFDGYLGYASRPGSALLRSQTESINIRRRALYTDLAGRRGVSPQEVGVTAGCTLLGRVGIGEAYLLSDGVWRRRMPGQAAPVPSYCTGG